MEKFINFLFLQGENIYSLFFFLEHKLLNIMEGSVLVYMFVA